MPIYSLAVARAGAGAEIMAKVGAGAGAGSATLLKSTTYFRFFINTKDFAVVLQIIEICHAMPMRNLFEIV